MIDTDQAATGRRDRKKRLTRAALTAAALRLVAERGLEHVTVEEISEAADVSSRTFFNYFACKDEALTDDPALDGNPVVARLAAAPPQVPALQAVRLALDEAIDAIQADRELWRLRLAVIAQNPTLLPRLIAGNIATERAMVTVIATRLGVGPDHCHPPLITAVSSAAFRTAMLRWAAGDDTRPLRDFVDEAFAAVAAGLPDPPHPS
ncbi:acyl-CoA-like ligand-binding transcription factor [Micromonospora sp. LH3U1]|uniref:acyl-CoA-like ligand-binding transcription factor n=1 Tax=Micromonospora sp. LH3U1 TaxID=3018339 RepID=UPI00234B61CD|nr:TetR family transcriptional regulator [Micromonospora sp. LH3U1]WCN79157.1 TetR family transcriptional regulator [Micromonospora sp. LH3U1]